MFKWQGLIAIFFKKKLYFRVANKNAYDGDKIPLPTTILYFKIFSHKLYKLVGKWYELVKYWWVYLLESLSYKQHNYRFILKLNYLNLLEFFKK